MKVWSMVVLPLKRKLNSLP
jgi:hypothetical protein